MASLASRTPLFPALLVAAAALGACGDDDAPAAAGPASAEDLLARQTAAAHAIESEFVRAAEVLRPLADREGAALEDLVHAASVALEPDVARVDDARRWIERASELAPDDPRVRWTLYRLAQFDADWDAAERHLRAVLAAEPDDLPAKLALGSVVAERGEEGVREAERLYREVVAVGPDFGGSWYAAAVYRLFRLAIEDGRDDEADDLAAEHARLKERGIEAPGDLSVARGSFGAVNPPDPAAVYPREDAGRELDPAGFVFALPERQTLALAEPRGLVAFLPSLRVPVTPGDPRGVPVAGDAGGNLGYVFPLPAGPEELLVFGTGGVAAARWSDGAWALETLLEEPAFAAAAFDLGAAEGGGVDQPAHAGDGDADAVVALERALVLLERKDGALERRPEPIARFETPPAAILAVDADHEGDLDLVLAGPRGATYLRNDGAHAPGGAFTDATAEAGLPVGRAFSFALAEDLDRDNDVDLLIGGSGGVVHLSNERGGRFSDRSDALPPTLVAPVAVRDADGDGWPDLRGADGALWLGGPSGAWRSADPATRPPGPPLLAEDAVDVPAGAVVCDKEGDGAPDVVSLAGGSLVTRAGSLPAGARGVRIALEGVKDNARGLGALVEIVLGTAYRRVYFRGPTLFVATHGRDAIDVLRVTWPNGVIQNAVGAPAEGPLVVKQRAGLVGSCPFLYAWDGERFAFVSDVLGITPLGLPMEPGMLVPPDHDEYVLVQGDGLAPLDGVYVLQITEELREVTYLDRVRLEAVDHPSGVEVVPNERFSFPPFPEPHVHALEGALAPVRATDRDGVDWTDALARDDQRLAEPFRALGGQFQGLAEPWFLELAFDPERVAAAPRLRLVLNGWLYWTDASVNVAAARHPGVEFVPPLLQVPDGEGGWRDAGVLGFPAGKLKTMVVDVTGAIDRSDPRVRVFTTLKLYWDSIRLAVDADDAPRVVTSVDPTAAELWERGFSRPLPHPEHPALETFQWEQLDEPRWNQHPGFYTRLGDCLELVSAIDDRFAILGAGDALTVRFPADSLPPLPDGWTRDFLVFFDGWAKDRDPNTVEALYVEPLPFHGMTGYPYGETERHPDDAYRRAWNTRPAKLWIPPLR